MTYTEFQAVIMAAGKGSRMTELTASRPKCLLPVGNLPMIWYPLKLLERSGFQEVIIVVLEQAKAEIQSTLEKCGLKIKFELVCIPGVEDWGTADSLRHLQESNKIKANLVVVSCDLITNINLSSVFDLFRKHDASLVAMFGHHLPSSEHPTPGPKTKEKTERDFVGIDHLTSKLAFIASASDYEEVLPFSKKLLHRYGKITLHTRLLDAHVYVMSRWMCSYLAFNKALGTLKGEVIPHIVKKHLSSSQPKLRPELDKSSIVALDVKTEINQFAQETELMLKVRNMSTYSDSRCRPLYNNESIRCYAHVTDKNSFLLRANTVQQYCLANREVISRLKDLVDSKEVLKISPLATVKSTQLDSETCLVAEKSFIAEKTSVKNSVIGPQVNISPKTRIQNCVIMNGVKIEEGCSITNCVICEEAVIEKNCDLKNCLIGSHHSVQTVWLHNNQIIRHLTFMENVKSSGKAVSKKLCKSLPLYDENQHCVGFIRKGSIIDGPECRACRRNQSKVDEVQERQEPQVRLGHDGQGCQQPPRVVANRKKCSCRQRRGFNVANKLKNFIASNFAARVPTDFFCLAPRKCCCPKKKSRRTGVGASQKPVQSTCSCCKDNEKNQELERNNCLNVRSIPPLERPLENGIPQGGKGCFCCFNGNQLYPVRDNVKMERDRPWENSITRRKRCSCCSIGNQICPAVGIEREQKCSRPSHLPTAFIPSPIQRYRKDCVVPIHHITLPPPVGRRVVKSNNNSPALILSA